MAYTPLSVLPVGTLITNTVWNTAVVENQKAQAPDIFIAAGDMAYATGPDAETRLAVGAEGEVLTIVGAVPAWAAPEQVFAYYGVWGG